MSCPLRLQGMSSLLGIQFLVPPHTSRWRTHWCTHWCTHWRCRCHWIHLQVCNSPTISHRIYGICIFTYSWLMFMLNVKSSNIPYRHGSGGLVELEIYFLVTYRRCWASRHTTRTLMQHFALRQLQSKDCLGRFAAVKL